jgi:hypothetical protein
MTDGQQIILDEVNGQQIVLQSGQSGQQESSSKLFTFWFMSIFFFGLKWRILSMQGTSIP